MKYLVGKEMRYTEILVQINGNLYIAIILKEQLKQRLQ